MLAIATLIGLFVLAALAGAAIGAVLFVIASLIRVVFALVI